jgi:hypothetical protein
LFFGFDHLLKERIELIEASLFNALNKLFKAGFFKLHEDSAG